MWHPTHKDCVNFKDGFCLLRGVAVDPNGTACPSFTPRNVPVEARRLHPPQTMQGTLYPHPAYPQLPGWPWMGYGYRRPVAVEAGGRWVGGLGSKGGGGRRWMRRFRLRGRMRGKRAYTP